MPVIRMKNTFYIGIALFIASGALAAIADDAKAVQGSWTPIKAELAGQAMPEALLKTISLRMTDGKYQVTVGDASDRGTYTLDPAAKPKGMSITSTGGANAGKTYPAIYEIVGDTLRICYDLSGAKQPAEFKTQEGTMLYLVTYGRKKA